MRQNRVKARLKAGETVFGCFVRYAQPSVVELMGYCEWDFVLFDAEHSTLEPKDCEDLVRAAELMDLPALIRVPANLQPVILRYMDTGALGVHVPMIDSRAEAEAAVRSVKYFPRGKRGLAAVRPADYAQRGSLRQYVQEANAETLVVLQIETRGGVDALAEILEVEDVDVVFIGPSDLSHALGEPGDVQHPNVQEVLNRAAERILASGKPLGMMVGHAEAARAWRDRGARYITVGLEPLVAKGCREYLDAVRPVDR